MDVEINFLFAGAEAEAFCCKTTIKEEL